MGWRDDSHGWLLFKLATGNNFSQGLLYVTEDGGLTWQQREAPLGEPVTFVDANTGWTAGGPAGDELYRTLDGGQSWQLQRPAGEGVRYLLPEVRRRAAWPAAPGKGGWGVGERRLLPDRATGARPGR